MESKKQKRHPKCGLPWMLMAGLYLLSLLALANGCQSKQGDTQVKTRLSMTSYIGAWQRARPGGAPTYYFPVLEIYNQAGTLIYASHNATANAKVLKDFPGSVEKLTPQPGAPGLQALISEIPDLEAGWKAAGGKNKLTILSIALENCKGCSIQEEALAELAQQLVKQHSAAVLEINVAP